MIHNYGLMEWEGVVNGRKGLVLLGIFLVDIALYVVFDVDSRLLGFLPSIMAMTMAFGDQYRAKVLKEVFWF